MAPEALPLIEEKNPEILEICLEAAQQIQKLRAEVEDYRYDTVELHPHASSVMGGQVSTLLTEGIIPVVESEGNPFGEPYHGRDEIEAKSVCIRRKLGQQVEATNIEIPTGNIKLIGTPFKFGPFIEPTPLKHIERLWEENKLGFQIELRQASHMSLAQCQTSYNGEDEWSDAYTIPAVEIAASPNQQALHYGCASYEGMSVERGEDGNVYIFRLKDHHERLNKGAKALGHPEVPFEIFEQMVTQTIQANKDYIPPYGKGRLYIRPNYYDAGPQLKLNHSGTYNLSVTAIPIGTSEAYFPKTGKPTTFALAINRARAVEHGIGSSKVAGNYAATIQAVDQAHDAGFSGLVYTDPRGEKVRESHVTGILFVKYKEDGRHEIVIPSYNGGDILESITVKTVRETAEDLGYKVVERDVDWTRIDDFDEVLAVGTAAAVTPIHRLQLVMFNDDNKLQPLPEGGGVYSEEDEAEFNRGEVGQKIFDHLCAIREGKVDSHRGYLTAVDL